MTNIDLSALFASLPISSLEPDLIGLITLPAVVENTEPASFRLVEPPAGQQTPYIDPLAALEQLARHNGFSTDVARERSKALIGCMKKDVPEKEWVYFFSVFGDDGPGSLPVPAFTEWLRQNRDNKVSGVLSEARPWVAVHLVDYIDRAAEIIAESPIFKGPDNRGQPWSLSMLPAEVPPKAMIEFMPGGPLSPRDDTEDETLPAWREAIRPVAQRLEVELGEQVYHFADENDDTDDDLIHRLLVLHACCTVRPDDPFVKYLVTRSGAPNVERLAAALIDPASYVQPFEMNDAFFRLEAMPCRLTYLPPDQRRTVVVAFASREARELAQWWAMQKIDADLRFVAPSGLVDEEWAQLAARYARSWCIELLPDFDDLNPVDLLADVNELCVIASGTDRKIPFDLDIPEALEDLLWAGLQGPTETKFYTGDGCHLLNPEVCLEKGDAPARVAARQSRCFGSTDGPQE